jgi:hypothetical protein
MRLLYQGLMFLSETLGGGPIELNGESFDDFAILRRFFREGSMKSMHSKP